MFSLKPRGSNADIFNEITLDHGEPDAADIVLGRNITTMNTAYLEQHPVKQSILEFFSRNHAQISVRPYDHIFVKPLGGRCLVNDVEIFSLTTLNLNDLLSLLCMGEKFNFQLIAWQAGKEPDTADKEVVDLISASSSSAPNTPIVHELDGDDDEGCGCGVYDNNDDDVVLVSVPVKSPTAAPSLGKKTDLQVLCKGAETQEAPLTRSSSATISAPIETAGAVSGTLSCATAVGSVAANNTIAAQLQSKLTRNYECGICFQPIAACFNLSCGCNFCFSCIYDWTRLSTSGAATLCPYCREEFSLVTSLPSKLVDNAIRDILSAGGEQGGESLEEWELRVEEGNNQRKAWIKDLTAAPGATAATGASVGTAVTRVPTARGEAPAVSSSSSSSSSSATAAVAAPGSKTVAAACSRAIPTANSANNSNNSSTGYAQVVTNLLDDDDDDDDDGGSSGNGVNSATFGSRKKRRRRSSSAVLATAAAINAGTVIDLT